MNSTGPMITLLLFALIGCQADGNRALTQTQAIEIANGFLEKNLPQVPLSEERILTEDVNGRWRVSYHAPPNSTGGPLIVEVDKDSGEVANFFMEQ